MSSSAAPPGTATAGSSAAARPTSSAAASRSCTPRGTPPAATGAPRTLALAYFALGDGARAAADGYLRDYYAFLGDYADMVAGSAAVDVDTVRQYVAAFAEAGCDELLLMPCDPDPAQVDLLADALG